MKFLNKYFPFITAILVFIVYLFTLAPSVIQIDSGELAAVQYTLGIAHPTGYPLFTLIGYIFLHIPLGISTITQANLLAALWVASAAGIFAYTFKMILDNSKIVVAKKSKKIKQDKSKKVKKEEVKVTETEAEDTKYNYIFASLAALMMAFSKTFWFQSTSIEVYSLHLLMLSLIILSLIKLYFNNDDNKILNKYDIFFAVSLALGFTNHMTTLLIIPGAAYIYFLRYKFNKRSFIKIGYMLLIFIPILILIYAYLPLRASSHPFLNWGNPVDLERMLRHISGKQYQVWIFSSTEAAKKQLTYFFNILPGEYTISYLFILIGLFASFIRAKKISIFFIILFISTILYSINYDIADIDSYFLLAFVSLSFFALYGIKSISSLLLNNKISYSISFAIVAILITIQMIINYPKVDQSGIYIYEDYTKELMSNAPKNSIILSYQWDYFLSASYYYQYVENFRKDLNIIDKELLRRSWYFNQLHSVNPSILKGIQNEQERFLEALKPFERSEVFDSQLLENLYRTIITKLITTNIDKHDIYMGPELIENEMRRGEFVLPEGYTLIPDLFLFKVVKNTGEYVPADNPDFSIRYPEEDNQYTINIRQFISSMLVRRALYEVSYNRVDRAIIYVKKIRKDFPEVTLPQELNSL